MYNLLCKLYLTERWDMESETQKDVHPQRTTSVGPILNATEIDIIEEALLEYGRQTQLNPETFRKCEAIATAYKKIGQARKAGCCDAIRMFGM